jgi:hypothetical protein
LDVKKARPHVPGFLFVLRAIAAQPILRLPMPAPLVEMLQGVIGTPPAHVVQDLEFLLRKILGVGEAVVGILHGKDQFAKLHLHRHLITVLRILNEKDH